MKRQSPTVKLGAMPAALHSFRALNEAWRGVSSVSPGGEKRPEEWSKSGSSFPSLTPWGYLPEGVYDSTLQEVGIRFGNSSYRNALWERAVPFLDLTTERGGFSHAYIAGGFVSAKPNPKDIDLILQPVEPYGIKAFKAMEPLFAIGMNTIYERFAVHLHFWCEAPPQNVCDFREFFQLLRPTDAHAGGMPAETRRGLIRICF